MSDQQSGIRKQRSEGRRQPSAGRCYLFADRRGQTLLELIVALGVILAGIIGSTTLILAATTAGRRSVDIVIGQNLAREGVEIVRSIRDSNWIDPNYPETRVCSPFPPPDTWDRDLIGNDPVTCAKNDPTAAPVIDKDGQTGGTSGLDYNANAFGAKYCSNNPALSCTTDSDCGAGNTCKDPTRVGLRGNVYVQPLLPGTDTDTHYTRLITFYRICWNSANHEEIVTNSNDLCSAIVIPAPADYQQVGLKVVSDVRWPTTGPNAKKVVLEDRLYNWRP